MKKYNEPKLKINELFDIKDVILTSSTLGGETDAGYDDKPFPGIYD